MIQRGDFFFCDNNCGFTETFDIVQEHEKTCKFRPSFTPSFRPETQNGSELPGEFTCDHGCGFIGTYAAVAKHEMTCVVNSWEWASEEFLRIGPPPPPPSKLPDGNNMPMNTGLSAQGFQDLTGYWAIDGSGDPTTFFGAWHLPSDLFEGHADMPDYDWYAAKGGIISNPGSTAAFPTSKGKGKGKGKSK
jgi:hypothetical protein